MSGPYAIPMGNPEQGGYDGMELRDWFAGQAMNGFFSQYDTPIPAGQTIEQVRETACASWYAWADAMLKARAQGNPA